MQNQDYSQSLAPVSQLVDPPNTRRAEAQGEQSAQPRKPFVEPQLSQPVGVLEATKFFAAAVVSGVI